MKNFHLPDNIKDYFGLNNLKKIISFMVKDKKNNSKKINLILLKKIGLPIIKNHYRVKDIKIFLRKEFHLLESYIFFYHF